MATAKGEGDPTRKHRAREKINKSPNVDAAVQKCVAGASRARLYRLDIERLPDSLWRLAHLKVLDVAHNRLEELPEALRLLPQLEKIHADHNTIRSIPHEVASLPRLRVLTAAHNAIASIPLALGFVKRLKKCDLSHNRIAQIPPIFSALPELAWFSVVGNPITHPPTLPARFWSAGPSTATSTTSPTSSSAPNAKALAAEAVQFFRSLESDKGLDVDKSPLRAKAGAKTATATDDVDGPVATSIATGGTVIVLSAPSAATNDKHPSSSNQARWRKDGDKPLTHDAGLEHKNVQQLIALLFDQHYCRYTDPSYLQDFFRLSPLVMAPSMLLEKVKTYPFEEIPKRNEGNPLSVINDILQTWIETSFDEFKANDVFVRELQDFANNTSNFFAKQEASVSAMLEARIRNYKDELERESSAPIKALIETDSHHWSSPKLDPPIDVLRFGAKEVAEHLFVIRAEKFLSFDAYKLLRILWAKEDSKQRERHMEKEAKKRTKAKKSGAGTPVLTRSASTISDPETFAMARRKSMSSSSSSPSSSSPSHKRQGSIGGTSTSSGAEIIKSPTPNKKAASEPSNAGKKAAEGETNPTRGDADANASDEGPPPEGTRITKQRSGTVELWDELGEGARSLTPPPAGVAPAASTTPPLPTTTDNNSSNNATATANKSNSNTNEANRKKSDPSIAAQPSSSSAKSGLKRQHTDDELGSFHSELEQSFLEFRQHRKRLKRWVISTVLTCPTVAKRKDVLIRFIEIALLSMQIGNLDSAYTIISALKNPSVSRLSRTWKSVPPQILQIFKVNFIKMASHKAQLSSYQAYLADSKTPYLLPVIDFYVEELTRIRYAHFDNAGSGGPAAKRKNSAITDVPFDEGRRAIALVEEIRRHQQRLQARLLSSGGADSPSLIMGGSGPVALSSASSGGLSSSSSALTIASASAGTASGSYSTSPSSSSPISSNKRSGGGGGGGESVTSGIAATFAFRNPTLNDYLTKLPHALPTDMLDHYSQYCEPKKGSSTSTSSSPQLRRSTSDKNVKAYDAAGSTRSEEYATDVEDDGDDTDDNNNTSSSDERGGDVASDASNNNAKKKSGVNPVTRGLSVSEKGKKRKKTNVPRSLSTDDTIHNPASDIITIDANATSTLRTTMIGTASAEDLEDAAMREYIIEDPHTGITFCIYGGKFMVKQATREALLDMLMDDWLNNLDPNFRDAFLLNRRHIVSAVELLDRLTSYYSNLNADLASKRSIAFCMQEIHRRTKVMQTLKFWMEVESEKLMSDKEFVAKLLEFIERTTFLTAMEASFFLMLKDIFTTQLQSKSESPGITRRFIMKTLKPTTTEKGPRDKQTKPSKLPNYKKTPFMENVGDRDDVRSTRYPADPQQQRDVITSHYNNAPTRSPSKTFKERREKLKKKLNRRSVLKGASSKKRKGSRGNTWSLPTNNHSPTSATSPRSNPTNKGYTSPSVPLSPRGTSSSSPPLSPTMPEGTSKKPPIIAAAEKGSKADAGEALRGVIADDPSSVRVTDSNGWTALHVAASMGDLCHMEILLDSGADVNAQTINGTTPLHYMMRAKLSSITTVPKRQKGSGDEEEEEEEEEEEAAATGRKDAKIAAIVEGRSPRQAEDKHKMSEYFRVLSKCAKELGANVSSQNSHGETLLHLAASLPADPAQFAEEKVRFLVDATRADVNVTNKWGETCLHIAARLGHAKMVEFLMDRHADANVVGINGHVTAVAMKYPEIVKTIEAKLAERLARGNVPSHEVHLSSSDDEDYEDDGGSVSSGSEKSQQKDGALRPRRSQSGEEVSEEESSSTASKPHSHTATTDDEHDDDDDGEHDDDDDNGEFSGDSDDEGGSSHENAVIQRRQYLRMTTFEQSSLDQQTVQRWLMSSDASQANKRPGFLKSAWNQHGKWSSESMFESQFAKRAALTMARIDAEMLRAIHIRELVGKAYSNESSTDSPTNVSAMIGHFNHVSQWVATMVIRTVDPHRRSKVVSILIKTATELARLKDYNSTYAVVAGLNFSSVSRLKATWAGLSSKAKKRWHKLETLWLFTENFKNYRKALDNSKPPVIPFVGHFTKNLFAIEENNPTHLPDGRVNFLRFELLMTQIRKLQLYQRSEYDIRAHEVSIDRALQHHLLHLGEKNRILDEDELYRRSKTLEE